MHKRGLKKLQARRIRGIILRRSFCDRNVGEVVSRVSRLDVMALLSGPVEVGLVPDVEKGEVLLDSRGRGSFQRCVEDGKGKAVDSSGDTDSE
jgi:hypothetical protein